MKQISIIGLPRSGKTCYIYAMAKTMVRGVNKISIFAPNDSMRDKLEEGWETISESHKWPLGTDKITQCDFNCLIHLRPVMDFCWDDYKGGILIEKDEVSQKERTEFFDYLKNSTGLIFCVPANMIMMILGDNDNDRKTGMKDLEKLNNYIIHQSILPIIKKIPITIAITKSDLLPDENAKKAAREITKELLNNLFDEGNSISALLVHVTLGEGLVGEQGKEFTGKIYDDPKKGNIHLPIMFNLYFLLKDYIKDTQNRINNLKHDLSSNSGDLSTVLNRNGFQRWLHGDKVNNLKTNIDNIRKMILQEEDYLRLLQHDIEKVRNEFTHDCEFYVNGKLQKF